MQQRSANEKFSTTLSRLDCFARCPNIKQQHRQRQRGVLTMAALLGTTLRMRIKFSIYIKSQRKENTKEPGIILFSISTEI